MLNQTLNKASFPITHWQSLTAANEGMMTGTGMGDTPVGQVAVGRVLSHSLQLLLPRLLH